MSACGEETLWGQLVMKLVLLDHSVGVVSVKVSNKDGWRWHCFYGVIWFLRGPISLHGINHSLFTSLVIDPCKTVWRVTLERSQARAGHPPWCFGSEDCHAPAGKTAGPFQADWPHSSSRWQKVLGPQMPGTWTGPHLPPPVSGWTGLAWWWVGGGPSGLKMKRKVYFFFFKCSCSM